MNKTGLFQFQQNSFSPGDSVSWPLGGAKLNRRLDKDERTYKGTFDCEIMKHFKRVIRELFVV